MQNRKNYDCDVEVRADAKLFFTKVLVRREKTWLLIAMLTIGFIPSRAVNSGKIKIIHIVYTEF